MRYKFLSISILMAFFCSCSHQDIVLEDNQYMMFSDTLYVLPVTQGSTEFEIPVVAMGTLPYERTFAVEVVEKESSAVEGLHYRVLDNTLHIPAGENVANVRIGTFYENLEPEDEFSFTLRLVCDENQVFPLADTDTRIELRKCKPFSPEDFSGPCLISRSTWFDSYMPSVTQKLIMTEAKEDGTVILRNFMYSGYDIEMRMVADDLLNPSIECTEQVFANTGEAFGTIYGDGNILLTSPLTYPSYFNTFEKFALLYMNLRVDGVGTVGVFGSILRWISEEEFEALKTEGVPFN